MRNFDSFSPYIDAFRADQLHDCIIIINRARGESLRTGLVIVCVFRMLVLCELGPWVCPDGDWGVPCTLGPTPATPLPSSNEDQMEFRYKHWCGRAERGRTRAPPCRRYSVGTASYSAHDPLASIHGPYIAIDGPGGPIITADHLTRDRTIAELDYNTIDMIIQTINNTIVQ